MNLGDRGDDRQPQAGAAVRAGAFGAGATEGPAELFDVVGVEPLAAVLDDELRARPLDRGADAQPALWLVVADGVLDHVLDHAGEQRRAAADPGVRIRPLLDVQALRRDCGGAVLDRHARELGEGERGLVGERPLLGLREREELSSSASMRSSSRRSRSASVTTCAGTGPGLAIATSSDARIPASGVRSSCEALATKRRSEANERSSRSRSSSKVSASSVSSSSGPERFSRSCRVLAEISAPPP